MPVPASTRSPGRAVPGGPGLSPGDRDEALREMAQRDAVEILAHHLATERRERARVQVRELFVTTALLGVTFGAGYALMRRVSPRALARRARRSRRS